MSTRCTVILKVPLVNKCNSHYSLKLRLQTSLGISFIELIQELTLLMYNSYFRRPKRFNDILPDQHITINILIKFFELFLTRRHKVNAWIKP